MLSKPGTSQYWGEDREDKVPWAPQDKNGNLLGQRNTAAWGLSRPHFPCSAGLRGGLGANVMLERKCLGKHFLWVRLGLDIAWLVYFGVCQEDNTLPWLEQAEPSFLGSSQAARKTPQYVLRRYHVLNPIWNPYLPPFSSVPSFLPCWTQRGWEGACKLAILQP